MPTLCRIKRSKHCRDSYRRNPEARRSRARVRKQRILIERAIAAARIELSSFNQESPCP